MYWWGFILRFPFLLFTIYYRMINSNIFLMIKFQRNFLKHSQKVLNRKEQFYFRSCRCFIEMLHKHRICYASLESFNQYFAKVFLIFMTTNSFTPFLSILYFSELRPYLGKVFYPMIAFSICSLFFFPTTCYAISFINKSISKDDPGYGYGKSYTPKDGQALKGEIHYTRSGRPDMRYTASKEYVKRNVGPF